MRKKDKQITFRVSQEEYRYLLHKAYGFKSFTDYMRTTLLKRDSYYNVLCESCVDCPNFVIAGGGVNIYLYAEMR